MAEVVLKITDQDDGSLTVQLTGCDEISSSAQCLGRIAAITVENTLYFAGLNPNADEITSDTVFTADGSASE